MFQVEVDKRTIVEATLFALSFCQLKVSVKLRVVLISCAVLLDFTAYLVISILE